MRILNLYAGIGGNRKLWGSEHEITAVEIDPSIAEIYHYYFPNDRIIIADAHQFLLEHYHEYDFIWSSPPCQSHSRIRHLVAIKRSKVQPIYPDMKLWQEIIFLQNYAKHWVVENVIPYYKPLIEPTFVLQRHYFWADRKIPGKRFRVDRLRKAQIQDLQELHGFDLSNFRLKNKRQILRNCVLPEIGKYILDYYTMVSNKIDENYTMVSNNVIPKEAIVGQYV